MTVERLFNGRVLDLHRETHRLPDGRDADFEIVRHPGGAAVLPVDDNGRLLLIRQFRPAAGGSIIEIPAGRIDDGEEPATCARRELTEEVGLVAEELVPLGAVFSTVGFCDERIHLFLARGLRDVPSDREADEFIEPFWVELSQALELIKQGDIPDAKTQLAVWHYQARLNAP